MCVIKSIYFIWFQGEVHVPQESLGTLLRTADALKVKGLAVPDDTITSSPNTESCRSDLTPTSNNNKKTVPSNTPSYPTTSKSNNATTTSTASPSLARKRKRPQGIVLLFLI